MTLPFIIKLTTPIVTDEGKTLNELVFTRKPRGADWIDFDLQRITPASYLDVAGKMLGIPKSFILKVEGEDVGEVCRFLAPFLNQIQ